MCSICSSGDGYQFLVLQSALSRTYYTILRACVRGNVDQYLL